MGKLDWLDDMLTDMSVEKDHMANAIYSADAGVDRRSYLSEMQDDSRQISGSRQVSGMRELEEVRRDVCVCVCVCVVRARACASISVSTF